MKNIKFIQIHKENQDLYNAVFPHWINYFDNLHWDQGEKPTQDEIIHDLNRRINIQGSRPDMHFELFFVDSDLVGFANFAINTGTYYGLLEAGYGSVMEFYIIPTFRRKGYGKLLYEHIEKTLKNHGAKKIYLTTDAVNGEAFWFAMGYHDSGIIDPDNGLSIYIKDI